jgi:hypothetical protein
LETKQCTQCLASLPLEEFYSKGNRTDAKCKSCVKSLKRSKYVAKEDLMSIDRLKKILDIVFLAESRIISKQLLELDKVVLKCQLKIPQ